MERKYITQRIGHSQSWSGQDTLVSTIDVEAVRKAIDAEYDGKYTVVGQPIVFTDDRYIMVTFEVSDYRPPVSAIGYHG